MIFSAPSYARLADIIICYYNTPFVSHFGSGVLVFSRSFECIFRCIRLEYRHSLKLNLSRWAEGSHINAMARANNNSQQAIT